MRTHVLVALCCLAAVAAYAEEDSSRIRYGMDLGCLHQQTIGEQQRSGTMMIIMHGQIQSILINPSGRRTTLALITQGTVAQAISPKKAWVFGFDIMPRVLFGGNERWRPYINGGIGFNSFGLEVPELSGRMQFTVLFGGGVEIRTSDRVAVTIEYRATHFSNNDMIMPNYGINAHTVLVGASIGR